MARHSSLRAADSDRDAVTERLRKAAAEGRLEPDELEDRVHTALRARTYGELERVVSDLPTRRLTRGSAVIPAARTTLAVATQLAVALVVITLVLVNAALTVARWLVCVVMRAHGYAAGRLGAQPGRPAV